MKITVANALQCIINAVTQSRITIQQPATAGICDDWHDDNIMPYLTRRWRT